LVPRDRHPALVAPTAALAIHANDQEVSGCGRSRAILLARFTPIPVSGHDGKLGRGRNRSRGNQTCVAFSTPSSEPWWQAR
jgi:hypothetical protein